MAGIAKNWTERNVCQSDNEINPLEYNYVDAGEG